LIRKISNNLDTFLNEQRLLAIDFGKKRIGIAVTDPLNLFAYPLITILNDTKIWNNLTKIISEYNVVKLIIGYPIKENGDESESSREVLKFKEELEKSGITKDDPDYKKLFAAKMANFKVAEVANHKRKVPPTFDQRVIQKEENLKNLEQQLKAKKSAGKKTESLETRIERAKLDIQLTKLTKEYNLGTSLKSYIDPTAYVKWAKKVKFDIEKFYPQTLRNKFSWALQSGKAQSSCDAECIAP